MNQKEKIKEALMNGEYKAVLRGQNGYAIGFDQYIGSMAPTDWTRVIPIIYQLSLEFGINDVKDSYEDALFSLLTGNEEDIYVAMGCFYFQIMSEERGLSPFKIHREKFIKLASSEIEKNENKLRENKKWMGANNENGLLAEVNRYRSLLKAKYNICM